MVAMGCIRAFSSVRLERLAHNELVLGSNPRRPIGGKQLADHLKGRDSEAEVAVNGALLYRPQVKTHDCPPKVVVASATLSRSSTW